MTGGPGQQSVANSPLAPVQMSPVVVSLPISSEIFFVFVSVLCRGACGAFLFLCNPFDERIGGYVQ